MDLDLLSPRERFELLTVYLDGELDDAAARDVTAWLDRHPEALREIEHQRRLWDLLGRYTDEPVAADFAHAIFEKTRVLEKTGAGSGTAERSSPTAAARPRLLHRRWAFAAAAAALLAVGALVVQSLSRGEGPGIQEPLALAGIDVDYVQNASLDDLLSLSDAQFEALLTEDPDALADASLGG